MFIKRTAQHITYIQGRIYPEKASIETRAINSGLDKANGDLSRRQIM